MTASEDYSNNMTCYILSDITEGLFIVVLKYTNDGQFHMTRINRGLNVIYNYMEKKSPQP